MIFASLLLALPVLADIPVSVPALRPATGVQWAPSLATNGSDAYAVWQDERALISPSAPSSFEKEIYAAHIAADGRPEPDFDFHPSPDQDRSPAIVWNGEDYVVARLVQAPDFTFRGIRFTSLKGDDRLVPSSELRDVISLGLAWNGEEYLAVMLAFSPPNYTIYGLLVDRSFHPIGSLFPITSGLLGLGSVVSDGHGFLVTWVDERRISIANVSASGAVATHEPLNDSASAGYFTTSPAAVWNGRRYLVTWSDPVVRARFVEAEGTPSSPALELFPSGGGTDVAWNGQEYLLPFIADDGQAIRAIRLDADGKAVDTLNVTSASTRYSAPAAVAMGNRFLVAWADEESVGSALVNGSTPAPRTVLANSLGAQGFAHGLFDGSNFAFAWAEEGTTYFGRVTPDGQQLDGPGIALGPDSLLLLASNGQQYAVALREEVVRIDRNGAILGRAPVAATSIASDGRDFLLLAARPVVLTAEGVLLPQPAIDDSPFSALSAAAAWNGSHYVVVYVQPTEPACYKCGQRYEVRTVLLDRGGRVASQVRTITAGRLPIFPFVATLVASGGGSTVTVFSDGMSSYAASIDAEGRPGAANKLPDFFAPRDLIWNGSSFLASGREGLRISADGLPLTTFALGPLGAQGVTFVHGAPRLSIVYDRPVPIAGTGSIERVFFDFIQEARRRAR